MRLPLEQRRKRGRIFPVALLSADPLLDPMYQRQLRFPPLEEGHPESPARNYHDTIRVFRGGPIWKKRDKSMTCHLLSAQTAFGPDASVVAIRIVAASGGDSTGARVLPACWIAGAVDGSNAR